MKYILGRTGTKLLEAYVHPHTLFAFDFDGTLAPIVREHDSAYMRESTAHCLSKLCQLFPTAIISGRGVSDVKARLSGVPFKYIIGNHGLEPAADMQRFEEQVQSIKPLLSRLLAHQQGVEIENKKYSLTVHYRKARKKKLTYDTIIEAIRPFVTSYRIIPGKCVINLLPEKSPHKGTALKRILESEKSQRAVFMGDDITDEDVFRTSFDGNVLSIRVGKSRASAASFYIRNQLEIDNLINRVLVSSENRR